MHNLDLILTLAGGFSAALILGYLTQRGGLSPIVGYLIAGTIVGPHTPGFVANTEIAEQLAEVGARRVSAGCQRYAARGSSRICTGEGEVALSLVENILERLGATAEQIDRERDRAHRELFGETQRDAPAEA